MEYIKKYLIIPTSKKAQIKKLEFKKDDSLFFALYLKYDNENSDFLSYVELPLERGEKFHCFLDGKSVEFSQTDQIDLDKNTFDNRPIAHFTVKNGWNNDPNGLIKIGDTYHMYYQYNPCSIEWGNMHWGHAISKDLFNWQECDVELFPDKMGSIFSGCAIKGGDKYYYFYTSAGEHSIIDNSMPYTQCLATSTDGFNLKKSNLNPVIPQIAYGNRDPKVVFSKTLNKYLMALYIEDKRYSFFTSTDLLKWEFLQDFTLGTDEECPDIMIFELDGTEYYAVIGANNSYVIGVFKDGKFTTKSHVRKLVKGDIDYAGQSFSGLTDRNIRISWNRLPVISGNFSQQMGLPFDVTIAKENGRLFLKTKPVDEIKNLYIEKRIHLFLSAEEKIPFEKKAYDISFDTEAGNLTLYAFGKRLRLNLTSPTVRIIADKLSLDVFYNDGKEHLSLYNPMAKITIFKASKPIKNFVYYTLAKKLQ